MKGRNELYACASDHLLLHRPCSAWLRSTLTDMDRKTETVLEVLVGNRDATISETEIHRLVSEVRNSYHAIADKCDSLLLMDQTSQSSEFTSSSSTSRSGEENDISKEVGLRLTLNSWDEMRTSAWKLMEDNLRQQEELIKRNDIKREEIARLGLQLEQLDKDNAQLKQTIKLMMNNSDEVKKRKRLLPRWISACFKSVRN